ncbi:MAG: hypothetical protein WC877_01245 [Dehalococcoidales bacterium]|jgi:hypothetical protein
MKITDLIEELQYFEFELGDVEVEIMFTNEFNRPLEYKDCDGTEVIESICEVKEAIGSDHNPILIISTNHEDGYIEGKQYNDH